MVMRSTSSEKLKMKIKKHCFASTGLAILCLLSQATLAEVKYSELVIEADSVDGKQSEKIFNRSVQSNSNANKIAEFDRDKLLRCWQHGQLIATERDWDRVNSQLGEVLFNKGSQKMSLYEFGETFCIYTGE